MRAPRVPRWQSNPDPNPNPNPSPNPNQVRSAELHYYAAGGSVADPAHRDQGSLLTLSVLLSEPTEYKVW